MKKSNISYVKKKTISTFHNLEEVVNQIQCIIYSKIIDPKPSVCINDDMTVLDYINEYNSIHPHSPKVMDSERDDSDINSDHTKGEVDAKPIDISNDTMFIYHNHDVNLFHNYYTPLLLSNNQEDVSSGTKFKSAKHQVNCHKMIFWIYY